MRIELRNVGKRFRSQWIFRNIHHEIRENDTLAITGPNGSGKSTLLKILSSFIDPSLGSVHYFRGDREVSYEDLNTSISICSPDLRLIEEFTLQEHLKFHFTFRKPIRDIEYMCVKSGLINSRNKRIQEFSSGMKQRLKLLLALYTKNEILLLDEPTANMDEEGIAWYHDEIDHISGDTTIIIASNQRYEYDFTQNILNISDYIS